MSCPNAHKANKKKPSNWPVFLSFLLVILPKCPFCFVAYSSAITLCGISEQGLSFNESFLVYGLVLIIALMLWINFRGRKTIFACSLVAMGAVLIAFGQYSDSFLFSYTWASYLILSAVFINSGLPMFIKSLYLKFAATNKSARSFE